MNNKTMGTRVPRRPSDVGLKLVLALGAVLGPALIIDLVALLQTTS